MKTLLRKHPYWVICLIAIVCVSVYWSLWATDRYVSRATIILQSAQASPVSEFSISSFLSVGGSAQQLLILREYLLSVDMLKKLNAKLNLRQHYSNPEIDFFSSLSSPDVPLGEFHEYYLERVTIEFDDYANVLRIEAQAFDPKTAHAIANMLLRAGERFMNSMNRRLVAEQVEFIKNQVKELEERLQQAKQALLEYQTEHQIVSPTGTVKTLTTVVATLQSELAKVKARKRALSATYSSNSSAIKQLNRQISALNSQIQHLRSRMTSSDGHALNTASAEYQALKLQVEFARKMYTNALAALETIQVQAASSLKRVAVLQSPTFPEYSTAPKRLHNIVVFIILAVLAALIVHLLAAIVRDHRD